MKLKNKIKDEDMKLKNKIKDEEMKLKNKMKICNIFFKTYQLIQINPNQIKKKDDNFILLL